MASNGKKFALTLSSTTRYFKKRTGSNGSAPQDTDKRGTSVWLTPGMQRAGELSPLSAGIPMPRSSSTGDVELSPDVTHDGNSPSPSVEMDDHMMSLTQHVQKFSNALTDLKTVICSSRLSDEGSEKEVHRRLEEVSVSVQEIITRYPAIKTSQILQANSALLDSCKNYTSEGSSGFDTDDLLADINNLALSVTNSVSEYWMADPDNFPHGMIKTKSLDCLVSTADDVSKDLVSRVTGAHGMIVGDGLDEVLQGLESGVELALMRAQAWSKYTKDLMSYVERRSSLWGEFARNVQKLAKSVQQSINEEAFLPFQDIYNTALNQDLELASMSQAAKTLIQNQTFVGPLNARRIEHDKIRKNLKYMWTKQVRKMHDAVANLRKARGTYMSRQHEYERVKETALKAESESQSLIGTGGSVAAKADARVEKKKKQEDDAMLKAMEAETQYKACVEEANLTQQQLICMRRTVLQEIRTLLEASDKELKVSSENYFKLMNTITDTIPQQFSMLSETCKTYHPGSHYAEYVRHLRPSEYPATVVEPFIFEPYLVVGTRVGDSIVSEIIHDGLPGIHGKLSSGGLRGGAFRLEDSDSISGGSSLSLESSPTTSPYQGHHQRTHTTEQDLNADEDQPRFDSLDDGAVTSFLGMRLSGAAQTHALRKLRAPSRCRECDSYVYFQGAECEKCGLTSHRRCLEVLRAVCTSSFPGSASYKEMLDVPELVKKCIQEINRKGLNMKGIYRVSAVKSKVEQVCCGFDEGSVNLADQNSNVVANVLKLYLRQLPEPLLTFHLYSSFIHLAKEYTEGRTVTSIVSALGSLVEQLPIFNYKTCMALMHHLYRVSRHEGANHMSVSNLGIVLGPTLLRRRDDVEMHKETLGDTPYQSKIVELLIDNVKTIFGVEDTTGTDCDADEMCGDTVPVESTDPIEGSISPIITTWYAPELTQDLLQELAKEGPHFQQLQQNEKLSFSSSEVTASYEPLISLASSSSRSFYTTASNADSAITSIITTTATAAAATAAAAVAHSVSESENAYAGAVTKIDASTKNENDLL